jgi:hypothetical protein
VSDTKEICGLIFTKKEVPVIMKSGQILYLKTWCHPDYKVPTEEELRNKKEPEVLGE